MSCVKALTLPSPSRNGKQKKTALSTPEKHFCKPHFCKPQKKAFCCQH